MTDATAPRICRQAIVTGHVQGVWYRGCTARRAAELGVTGWAKNTKEGTVEVLACGTAEAVEALCSWLWTGSPASRVTGVSVTPVDVDPPSQFTTGRK